MRTISTVIIKPTKGCNADCSYCCAPPDGAKKWSIADFRRVFDALESRLHPNATLIWHGGEPMLLGAAFYKEAHTYATSRHPGVRFSMQSNMLAYNDRWNELFKEVFNGSVSTSWDPDELCRSVNGRTDVYGRVYRDKMKKILSDGWRPKVISTFTEDTIHLAHNVYDQALTESRLGRVYDIRINYRYPAGRVSLTGPAIEPSTYGRMLIELYDRWISDTPDFLITPLDQMFLKVTGREMARCPWAKGCTGSIIGLEPNYDIYNCGEFADLADPEFRFGNLFDDGIEACMTSTAARKLTLRRIRQPKSCQSCIHFTECEGGCMRDAVIFDRGIYGKFFYCESWQDVFSRIKESIITGEADTALKKFGHDVDEMKDIVGNHLRSGLASGLTHMRRPVLTSGYIPSFATLHGPVDLV
ncbi:radical SAM protein [Loktanella sp. DJP18]|uniref:radical SAM protein n=1 Tax=Loktanella sp. DJP18 TaxID=3409788 RepID=UPI003BB4FF1E